jgi:hypothetical protein
LTPARQKGAEACVGTLAEIWKSMWLRSRAGVILFFEAPKLQHLPWELFFFKATKLQHLPSLIFSHFLFEETKTNPTVTKMNFAKDVTNCLSPDDQGVTTSAV